LYVCALPQEVHQSDKQKGIDKKKEVSTLNSLPFFALVLVSHVDSQDRYATRGACAQNAMHAAKILWPGFPVEELVLCCDIIFPNSGKCHKTTFWFPPNIRTRKKRKRGRIPSLAYSYTDARLLNSSLFLGYHLTPTGSHYPSLCIPFSSTTLLLLACSLPLLGLLPCLLLLRQPGLDNSMLLT